jgi:hypothetical protein
MDSTGALQSTVRMVLYHQYHNHIIVTVKHVGNEYEGIVRFCRKIGYTNGLINRASRHYR